MFVLIVKATTGNKHPILQKAKVRLRAAKPFPVISKGWRWDSNGTLFPQAYHPSLGAQLAPSACLLGLKWGQKQVMQLGFDPRCEDLQALCTALHCLASHLLPKAQLVEVQGKG